MRGSILGSVEGGEEWSGPSTLKVEPMGLAGDWVWGVNERSRDDPAGPGLNDGKDGSVGSCVHVCPAAICSALEGQVLGTQWLCEGRKPESQGEPSVLPAGG